MTFTLPKRTRVLWQVRIVFLLAVLCAVVVSVDGFAAWIILPTAIVLTIGSAFAFVYIPLYFNSFKITLRNDCICITKGVIIKSTYILPSFRLVLVKSVATPLVSALKLEFILLKVARGWIVIPEVNNIDAKIILDALKGDEIGE